MANFADSVGRLKAKTLLASRGQGAFIYPLTRSSAHGSRWGLCPQTPLYTLAPALATGPLTTATDAPAMYSETANLRLHA